MASTLQADFVVDIFIGVGPGRPKELKNQKNR